MLRLRRCSDAPGLAEWVRRSLEPYYPVVSQSLVAAELRSILTDVPVLLDPPETGCVWSGRVEAVACWQLHDDAGTVVARVATAPKSDLRVPESIVQRHPYSYHQSAIGAGREFVIAHPQSYSERAFADGPGFSGYIIDDDVVGCLSVKRGQRVFYLVAQFPGASVADSDGYWDGEAILARLQLSDTDVA
jgi:hypothetical protein